MAAQSELEMVVNWVEMMAEPMVVGRVDWLGEKSV